LSSHLHPHIIDEGSLEGSEISFIRAINHMCLIP